MGDVKDRLVARALEEGFDACRVCRPWDVPQVPGRLAEFLEKGRHGQMGWLAERSHWRGAPQVLWPEARSVIVLGESYTPDMDPMATLDQPEVGTVSVYARNRDYHDTVKKRLKRLARWLIAEGGGDVKVFVDTAPVPGVPGCLSDGGVSGALPTGCKAVHFLPDDRAQGAGGRRAAGEDGQPDLRL